MQIENAKVTILKASSSDFVGREGKTIRYNKVKFLDSSGNIFEGTLDSALIPICSPMSEGKALLEFFMGTSGSGEKSRPAIKVKLLNFTVAK